MHTYRFVKFAFAVTIAATLVACGGDDDGDGGNEKPNPPDPTLGVVVGGTVSGLTANKSLVLQNNGGGDLRLQENGKFAFAKAVDRGSRYAVTVLTQPEGMNCGVEKGTGTADADVNTIVVTCAVTGGGAGGVDGSISSGLTALSGNWIVPDVCAPGPGENQSSKANWRFASDGKNRMNEYHGPIVYNTTNCSGNGSLAGEIPAYWTHTLRSAYMYQGFAFYRVATADSIGASGNTLTTFYMPNASRVCMIGDDGRDTDLEVAKRLHDQYNDLDNCAVKY